MEEITIVALLGTGLWMFIVLICIICLCSDLGAIVKYLRALHEDMEGLKAVIKETKPE